MIHPQLRESITHLVKLNEEELARFAECMEPVSLKKGQYLLKENEYCRHVYFIISGCLRYFYLVDGEERIGQFFFENAWISDLYSFLSHQPSRMNIAAIEPCTLLSLRYETLQRLYEEVPKAERFGRLIIEHTFVAIQQRSASFLTMTPEEKYKVLVHTRPKVVARVPQYMIAAYLGIKPESLSRIRKKMTRRE